MAMELTIYNRSGQATKFGLVTDSSSKRALVRNYRATNASDPGRIRRASWEFATPIGMSHESTSNGLGCDYAQNLDTRFPRRLISKGARNAVTLTSKDPVGVSSSYKLGEFKFGDVTVKMGGPVSATDSVTAFAEQGGYLFAFRGRLATQIAISGWTVASTQILPEPAQGAKTWYGKVRVGQGSAAPMKTLTDLSATGAVFSDTTDLAGGTVYASRLAVGSDRCWYVTKSITGELDNQVSYTLNDFETTANPFTVGDAKATKNGIGPFGPFTFIGDYTNIYSFTDQAKKVPLSKALEGHSSANNGSQFADPGWGWLYAITDVGLRAMTSHIDNPVGPGESMRQFTGHGGIPTALWSERGELFVVYNSAGDLYAYRATFGPETSQTGQPLFYPWWYRASTTCKAIFSTNTPTNPAIVWGEGTNMAYETISRDGRDDLFSSRTYDTGGGTWYGTELDRDPHMLKVLRLSRLHAKNLTSGSTWTLAWSFDAGSYVNMPAITESGFHTVRPVQDPPVSPLESIAGRAMKPRLTQVAAGSGASTTPPELAGTLEVEYDERPSYITEVALTIDLTGTSMSPDGTISALEEVMGSQTDGPIRVRLPNESTDSWAMVQNVTNRRDLKADAVEGIDVILHLWDVE